MVIHHRGQEDEHDRGVRVVEHGQAALAPSPGEGREGGRGEGEGDEEKGDWRRTADEGREPPAGAKGREGAEIDEATHPNASLSSFDANAAVRQSLNSDASARPNSERATSANPPDALVRDDGDASATSPSRAAFASAASSPATRLCRIARRRSVPSRASGALARRTRRGGYARAPLPTS
eukprot:30910-Pelagococcus_subviridis.AAC.5